MINKNTSINQLAILYKNKNIGIHRSLGANLDIIRGFNITELVLKQVYLCTTCILKLHYFNQFE